MQEFDFQVNNMAEVKDRIEAFGRALNTIESVAYFDGKNIFDSDRAVSTLDLNFENVICTTYFSTKQDPQRQRKIKEDNINYILPWYNSVRALNLKGLVFYDNLSESFVKTYETDSIRFVKCRLGNYSLNDERFILFYMFFLKHKAKQILLTDGNDVIINRSPFDFMENKCENTIYVGRGSENKLIHSNWNLSSVQKLMEGLQTQFPNNFYDMAIYNAGIIGGSYVVTLFFLRQICSVFFKVNNAENNNMAAMHYVLYRHFYPNCRKLPYSLFYKLLNKDLKIRLQRKLKAWGLDILLKREIDHNNDTTAVSKYIFSGYPLNSRFKQYESTSKAFIIHK